MTESARFRYRDETGVEHEFTSVEELSRRVEQGDLGADTQLLDAGVGEWKRAGDLPIFQFIVDELRREGRLPDSYDAKSSASETDRVSDPDPDTVPGTDPDPDQGTDSDPDQESDLAPPPDSAPDSAADLGFDDELIELADEGSSIGDDLPGPEEHSKKPDPDEADSERMDLEDLPLTPDPFEMHLPKSMEEPDEDPPAADPDDRPDDMSLHDWLMTQSDEEASEKDDSGPAGTGDDRDEETGRKRPPRPPEDPWGPPPRGHRVKGIEPLASDAAPTGGTVPSPLERDAPSSHEPGDWDELPADEPEDEGSPGEIRSRPPPPRRDGRGRSPYRRQGWRRGMVIGLLVTGGAVLAIAILLMTGGDDVEVTPTPPQGSPVGSRAEVTVDLPPFPVPDELDPAPGQGTPSERMATLMTAEMEGILDSIRAEMGIEVVPPAGWLSGEYLSSASRFEGTADFWVIYESFVERLADEDRTIYMTASRRAWGRAAGYDDPDDIPSTDPDLDAFIDEVAARYELLAAARSERYQRRAAVARSALALHEFLVEFEGRIQHAPALGEGLSADPILEAVPSDAEARRQLNRHLDQLFVALDQTRSGIPPALGGLRTELFQRLASLV